MAASESMGLVKGESLLCAVLIFIIDVSISVCFPLLFICFRALEMLQEINQSENRRSSFSKLAMMSLLNSNMSVKYSLTGHLTATDMISNGFYDAGKVCVCVHTLDIYAKIRSFSRNVIGMEFSLEIYDIILFPPCQVCATQRILTLEELSGQPVNQHRPIIVVNTAAEYVILETERTFRK